MDVTGKVFSALKKQAEKFTVTDKRVAAVLSGDAEFVAFSTVAEVAKKAQTSGPSIVRFAEKIGFAGFVGLQKAVRDDLSKHLSSSLKRINQSTLDNSIAHVQAIEIHNVESTLSNVDEKLLNRFIKLLSDDKRAVFILASDQCFGPAVTFRGLLGVIRPGVHMLKGSPYRISNQLLNAKTGDLLLTMDFERYESWVVKTHGLALTKKLHAISVTNNPLSSLANMSRINFFASATAAGPFDSNTGLNALLNLFVSQLAELKKDTVSKRLSYAHKQWNEDGVFE